MANPLGPSSAETQPLLAEPPRAPSGGISMEDGVHLESHLGPLPEASRSPETPQISWAKTRFAAKLVLLGAGAGVVVLAAPISVPFVLGFATGWTTSALGGAWSSQTHTVNTGAFASDMIDLFKLPIEPFKWPKAELDYFAAVRAATARRRETERQEEHAEQERLFNEGGINPLYEATSRPPGDPDAEF